MNKATRDDLWESRELGGSEEHAEVAPAEYAQALDDSLGMQLISIRLQKQLIGNLKKIAEYHGIAYQPMIRDLLNRFAASELRQILEVKLKEVAAQERAFDQEVAPVSSFIERERERKIG